MEEGETSVTGLATLTCKLSSYRVFGAILELIPTLREARIQEHECLGTSCVDLAPSRFVESRGGANVFKPILVCLCSAIV